MTESFRCFAFTIRPHSSENASFVNDDLLCRVRKFIEKHDGGSMVQEMMDEPENHHIHATVYLSKSLSKGDFTKSIESLVKTWAMKNYKNWTTAQNRTLRKGVKIVYNSDFEDDYLTKENNPDIDNRPANFKDYYPSQASQDSAIRKANAVCKQHSKWFEDFIVSPFYLEYKCENLDLLKIIIVGRFFKHQFYCAKTYQPIKDTKILRQNINSLRQYIDEDENDLDYLTKEEKENLLKYNKLKEEQDKLFEQAELEQEAKYADGI